MAAPSLFPNQTNLCKPGRSSHKSLQFPPCCVTGSYQVSQTRQEHNWHTGRWCRHVQVVRCRHQRPLQPSLARPPTTHSPLEPTPIMQKRCTSDGERTRALFMHLGTSTFPGLTAAFPARKRFNHHLASWTSRFLSTVHHPYTLRAAAKASLTT
jgi:hypothetical protein